MRDIHVGRRAHTCLRAKKYRSYKVIRKAGAYLDANFKEGKSSRVIVVQNTVVTIETALTRGNRVRVVSPVEGWMTLEPKSGLTQFQKVKRGTSMASTLPRFVTTTLTSTPSLPSPPSYTLSRHSPTRCRIEGKSPQLAVERTSSPTSAGNQSTHRGRYKQNGVRPRDARTCERAL